MVVARFLTCCGVSLQAHLLFQIQVVSAISSQEDDPVKLGRVLPLQVLADVEAESRLIESALPSLVQVAAHTATAGAPLVGHGGGAATRYKRWSGSSEAPPIDLEQQYQRLNSFSQVAALSPAAGIDIQVLGLFTVLVLLCALSVGSYVMSVMSPPSFESAAQATAPAAAALAESSQPTRMRTSSNAANDDDLGLKTPTGAEAAKRSRGVLQRRASITVAELKHWKLEDAEGSMSEFSFVVNMFADLAPPGMLPLAYCLKNTGYVPAFIILAVFYMICVFTMFAVAQTTNITGGKDYASQWRLCVNPNTAWMPLLLVVCVCFGTLISYSCFFADIFEGVMPAFGLDMSRTGCLLAFTLFPTLPLCLLKNLSALSSSSSFALVATLYTVVIITMRWLDGTYAAGGKYVGDLEAALAPNVPSEHLMMFGLPSLVLVNALALGFLTHYNACKYYRELRNHTPRKLATYTSVAMGLIAMLFGLVMVAGFQTFGTNCDSVILKNYSRNDTAINISRLGMGFSIVASFPLMFSGLREACINLLKMMNPATEEDWDLIVRQDVVSMVLLFLVTVIAAVVTDAGLVVGVVGSLCGISVIYVIPSVLYTGAIRTFLKEEQHQGLVMFLRFLMCMGVVMAVAGCASTLIF